MCLHKKACALCVCYVVRVGVFEQRLALLPCGNPTLRLHTAHIHASIGMCIYAHAYLYNFAYLS